MDLLSLSVENGQIKNVKIALGFKSDALHIGTKEEVYFAVRMHIA